MPFVDTIREFGAASIRRKSINLATLESSNLRRCLSTWELTLFGIGATMGSGLYIITGQVAKDTAGPGVIASYAIAALACLFSAVCYAEFAVRLPRAGSSYTYCYATVGELIAFIVGWNVIFENIVGFSSVAKAWSQYMDSFLNYTIQHHLEERIFPGGDPVYFDVLGFGLVVVFTVVVSVGAHITSAANVVFTAINIFVCILIVVIGSFYIDVKNWSNFAPFGFAGIIKGSGKCFYAMLGFDCVATTSEETHDKNTVPKAMLLTLLISFLLFFTTAAILTLIWPYNDLNANEAFSVAFDVVGAHWAKYVIAIGALCSLTASILGSLYSASRITYSMAHDGLIFRTLGWVPKLLKTPVIATVVVGIIGALMALILDLSSLIEMTSIGTLMAYSSVSASLLILRYQPWTVGFVDDGSEHNSRKRHLATTDEEKDPILREEETEFAKYNSISFTSTVNNEKDKEEDNKIRADGCGCCRFVLSKWENFLGTSNWQPNERTGRWAVRLTATYCCTVIATALFVLYASSYIYAGSTWALVLLSIFVVLLLLNAACFFVLPMNSTQLFFRVPAVPTWCLVSLALNLSIMMTLSVVSWIRVVVWLTFGLAIYYAYGVRHSNEHDRGKVGLAGEAEDSLKLTENAERPYFETAEDSKNN